MMCTSLMYIILESAVSSKGTKLFFKLAKMHHLSALLLMDEHQHCVTQDAITLLLLGNCSFYP